MPDPRWLNSASGHYGAYQMNIFGSIDTIDVGNKYEDDLLRPYETFWS